MMALWGRSALGAVLLLAGGPVMAQAAPPAPPPVPPGGDLPSPGQLLPSRGQIERPAPPEPPRRSTARVEERGALTAAPCALEGSAVRIDLTSVTFENPQGGAIAPQLQTLLASVGDAFHGDQPVSVVCRIRDRINSRLSEAGYVALAQILPQQIQGGVLRMQIVTAHITEMRVVGDPGPFRGQIEARIARLRGLDPLNRHEAEHILLLAGDIPGVDVTLTLSSANAAPGEVIGTLEVSTQRILAMANVQDFGSTQLGRWVASLRVEAYGLTGLADRTYVTYSNSIDWNEVRVAQAGHDFALDNGGLRLSLYGSLAWSRPDIENLDIRSHSLIAGAELDQTLIRRVRQQLTLAGGVELLNQQSRIHQAGTQIPLTRDRLRVAFARMDGQFRFDSRGAPIVTFNGSVTVRKGLDVLDASRTGQATPDGALSRFDGNPQATVIRGELASDITPPGPAALHLEVFGQWADDPLLNLEEFSLGNYTHGRGYDPGSNGGDRAWGFSVEPRYRLPLGHVQAELMGFYDWVWLDNLDQSSSETDRHLRSVGGGIRIALPRQLVLDVVYAHPLDRALTTDKNKPSDRVLVSLVAKLYPWGSR